MRAQMKRVFAMLLTAMLVIDSQSSACSSLVSFGAGARNVLAADITEENIDDVDPGSVENVVVTAGDTVSVDFADGAAEDDTSYNEVNEADDDKGDEDAEDAADNEDASVEEDQSVSEDPVSANAFEIQESDTEMTESDQSAASGQEDQSSEEQFEEQTAEGSEAAAADASVSDPENTGDEQDDLSIDMPEQTDEEDAILKAMKMADILKTLRMPEILRTQRTMKRPEILMVLRTMKIPMPPGTLRIMRMPEIRMNPLLKIRMKRMKNRRSRTVR